MRQLMTSSKDKKYLVTLLLMDGLMVFLGYMVNTLVREHSGLFAPVDIPDKSILPMLVIGIYWLIVFWMLGMYRNWFAQSRLDEFLLSTKTITVGSVILFFLIFVDDAMTNDPNTTRLKIVVYWLILVTFVGSGRLILRSIRRRMLILGIGLRCTILIGSRENSAELAEALGSFPGLGHKVLGYLSSDDRIEATTNGLMCFGGLSELERTLEENKVEEIIIAIDSSDHDLLLNIIGRASASNVSIKIRPDLYDIVSGQAKTNQIYGIPLIEVSAQLMPPWEMFMKRAMDLTVSFLVLVLGIPFFLLISIVQKLTSKGPILYNQERTGKNGKVFTMLKFRTMYTDAEKRSGPQWAVKNDPRVTPIGRFLRKSHLDELPQALNVFQGDMSLVGPRPERPFFVDQFVKEIPLYRRRLNVRPGITGWAQVKHIYDTSIEDVKAKLKFDLYYIENMSIRMDMKIILNTLYRMLAGKGQA
jgi:exopolysaccharide biosynthesis polyprenyl glycosylphosphotransferase